MKRTVLSVSLFTALTALTVVQSAYAKTPEEVRAACRAEGRPCVGLVLSGGGARGFAHAGVLRLMEEMGIRVDVVTGTSMGSMVGGAYAAGYTAGQIEDIIEGVNWTKMMASRADRSELPWRLKLDDYKNLPNNAIMLTQDGKIELPESVIPSQELEIFLNNKAGPVNYVNDLSELALPYACVATDLVTGERVIMQKDVNLGRAMRASMSVPGAFAPVVIKDRMLVDGGLVDNLPVQLARDMGADVVIAVNLGTPLSKRSELNNVVNVMAQMVNLLTEQNVQKSLASLTDADVLISPDLDGFSSADFKKSKEIIERGYEAALKVRDKLEQFAISDVEWLTWETYRERAVLPATRRDKHQLAEVRVEGLEAVNPDAVMAQVNLNLEEPVANKDIDEMSRRIWAEGSFSSVRYSFEPGPAGTEVLVLEPKEQKHGTSKVRIGASLETDFEESHTFNVIFAHTWGWVNSWGGELRTELQGGQTKRVNVNFYQPIAPTFNWFLMPELEYEWQPFDYWSHGENIARFRNETFDAALTAGYAIGRQGALKLTSGYLYQRTTKEIGVSFPRIPTSEALYVSTELYLDTLDNVSFPTKGYRLDALAGRLIDNNGGTGKSTIYSVAATWPLTIGRWTTVLHGEIGQAAMPNVFNVGGAFRLTGSPYGRWTGSHMQLGTVRVSRNMSDMFGSPDQPIWTGVSLEAGRAWNKNDPSDENTDKWHKAIGAFVGVDSVIGPLHLMIGETFDEDWGMYFFWGYKF